MANLLCYVCPTSYSRYPYCADMVAFLESLGHTVTEAVDPSDVAVAGFDAQIELDSYSSENSTIGSRFLSDEVPSVVITTTLRQAAASFGLPSFTYGVSGSPPRYYVVNYDFFVEAEQSEDPTIGVETLGSPISASGVGLGLLRTVSFSGGGGSPVYTLTGDGAAFQEFQVVSTSSDPDSLGHFVLGYDESSPKVGGGTLPAKLIAYAWSAAGGATPGSAEIKKLLQESINWVLDIASGYQTSGGFQIGGSGEFSPGQTYPTGGFQLFGSAEYSRTVPGSVKGNWEATGGLQITGQAIVSSFQSSGLYDNERWTEIETDEAFLYGRLKEQRNQLGAIDSGPEVWGDLLEGNGVIRWDFLYDWQTGSLTLNGEELFILADILKIDGTVDGRGYPLVAYELPDNNIYVYEWVHAMQDFQHRKVANGTQPFICFYGTRINSVGEPVLIYLDGATLVERRGSELFAIPYSTSLVVPSDLNVKLEGLGQTPSNRLQFKVRVTYER